MIRWENWLHGVDLDVAAFGRGEWKVAMVETNGHAF